MMKNKSPLRLDLLFLSGAAVNVNTVSRKALRPITRNIGLVVSLEMKCILSLILLGSVAIATLLHTATIQRWLNIEPQAGNQSEPQKPTPDLNSAQGELP